MDAVFLSVKQAHLAAGHFGRRVLARFALTPARFDLLVAIGFWGKTQREVRRLLGLARSTVSELVDVLVGCGLVRRSRATDRRTWHLRWTARGRELLERAYDECINDGFVSLSIDRVLACGQPEIDTDAARFSLIETLRALAVAFGRGLPPDLYCWHPDDYVGALTRPGEDAPEPEVPFAT